MEEQIGPSTDASLASIETSVEPEPSTSRVVSQEALKTASDAGDKVR